MTVSSDNWPIDPTRRQIARTILDERKARGENTFREPVPFNYDDDEAYANALHHWRLHLASDVLRRERWHARQQTAVYADVMECAA